MQAFLFFLYMSRICISFLFLVNIPFVSLYCNPNNFFIKFNFIQFIIRFLCQGRKIGTAKVLYPIGDCLSIYTINRFWLLKQKDCSIKKAIYPQLCYSEHFGRLFYPSTEVFTILIPLISSSSCRFHLHQNLIQ